MSRKRYRCTGMERAEETGLRSHGVRSYAPWLGRWASAHSIGLGGEVNAYGKRTSASLVDGRALDVHSPASRSANRIISASAKNNDRATGVVFDLAHTDVTPEQYRNVVARLQGAGANRVPDVTILTRDQTSMTSLH